MKLPRVQGVIRRRLLVNFRVEPEVASRLLPPPFRPKLQRGYAIAGICLIRLEQIRPPFVPFPFGLHSENAAHRIAVIREDSTEAVYIPRRDSDSWVNQVIGGRLFSGEHHRARFEVEDDGCRIDFRMRSSDGTVSIAVTGRPSPSLPGGSVFDSLEQASRFFEGGSLGYSATADPNRFEALVLETQDWRVDALDVTSVASSFFEDPETFPEGSVSFDHALIMRNLRHEWRVAQDLYVREVCRQTGAAY